MSPKLAKIIELFKNGFRAFIKTQEKILELINMELKFKEENIKLKKRIKKLEKELYIKHNLEFNNSCYWLEKDGKKKEPFCQKCYDDQGKLSRVHAKGDDIWYCYVCETNFYKSNYVHTYSRSYAVR